MARRQSAKKTQEEIGAAVFIGSTFSNEELLFLLDHFGEPPEVAMPEDEELPEGVNAAAITPILNQTYRLNLLEQSARKQSGNDEMTIWAGFDALRDICQKTLDWNAVVRDLKERTKGGPPELRRAAGAPSLHMWDPDTDIPYLGGVGADSGITMTALGEGGERTALYIALRQTGLGSIKSLAGVAKFLRSKSPEAQAKRILDSVPNALDYDKGETTSVVRCPICGHTEVYETTKPSTKRAAEQKMVKHLGLTKIKKDQHKMLANRLKSGKAGTGSANRAPAPAPEPEDSDEEMVEV